MSNPPPATDRRALLQNALQSLDEMQAKLDAVEKARQEPIAIIGMGCRFPGNANSPEEYWRLLRDGIDAVSELPEERGALVGGIDDLVDPKTLQGGFLRGIDGFDPQFFGMSPREATSLDPQQRMMLEVSWEALERAGIAPDSLAGSATGVFVGITTNDYGQLLRRDGMALDVYAATGSALNAAPGRVAYTLGLQGPALAVDSACSSSLVAVHLAVQSLRSGESNLALAGGVNATLMPDAFVCFTRWGMLAADGRCKAFDVAADGFVRGEGCGVVALKRLTDAQADGDPILAVIRGTASNQDGRSAGLTVPSGAAQRAVIQAAMEDARVEPARVQYIEAHGTGTSLGDPIEVEAIGGALGTGRGGEIPLYLGSVKTNFGHLESASGIAGLIKVVLMFQHGQIPPHLHLNERNPNIPWPDFPIEIPTALSPWPDGDGPRLAGVSGFGLSGTNAHVVLEGAPAPASVGNAPSLPRHPLVLSARDAGALRDIAGSYAAHLRAHPEVKLADVAVTASQGRAHLPLRLALSAATIDEAAEKLSAFAAGQTSAGLTTGQAPLAGKPRPAFLFTGQGAQYAGMGRDLYKGSPVFRDALDRCAAILAPYLDRPLLEVLFAEPETPEAALLNQTSYTQPALFAFEYALAALWESWGVRPACVAGHSLGEYVAACVAGVLSLEDALTLVAIRGRLMGALPAGGAMAAVFAPEAEVRQAIAPYGTALSVAAINGSEHTVIAGEAPAVEAVSETLLAGGARVQALTVSHAFHSALMEPILDEFEEVARRVTFRAPRIPFLANLTGEAWTEGEALDAGYWRRHLREPVQFAATLNSMHAAGYDLFLEIGPHPVLAGMGRARSGGAEATWLPSLRRGRDEWTTLLDALGGLFVAGVDIDWKGVTGDYAGRRVDLPTYPFQHQRYWTSAAQAGTPSMRRHLLGKYVNLATDQDCHLWEGAVDTASFPYLDDHRVQGAAVLPATGYVEMVIAAAADIFGEQPVSISEVEYEKPIIFSDGVSFTVQVLLRTSDETGVGFEIFSRPAAMRGRGGWTRNTHGTLLLGDAVEHSQAVDIAAVRGRCTEHVDGATFYRRLAERGNQWGPAFQGVASFWRGEREALSLVRVPESLLPEVDRYQFHPAVSDACGHVLVATLPLDDADGHGGAFVGGSIDEARVYRRPVGANLWAYARLRPDADERSNVVVGDVQVLDEDGELVSETIGARLWYLDEHEQPMVDPERWIHTLEWESDAAPVIATGPDADGTWIILADARGDGAALADELRSRGGRCVLVRAGETFQREAADSYTLRPDAPADFVRLVSEALGEDGARGIVHFWSLDTPPAAGSGAAELLANQGTGLVTALYLVQAVAAAQLRRHPRIWLVTRAAQPAGGVDVDPAGAPLWGMGRSLALEHSELWGGLIDLGPDDEPGAAGGRIASEIIAGTEDQVALRGDERFVARLSRPDALSDRGQVAVQPDASYLITGGFGGLGLRLANRIAIRGARHLILVGRTPLPPRDEWERLEPDSRTAVQVAAVRALEDLGVSVHAVAADVADEFALRAALDAVSEAGAPPIAGVFHAAGTLNHGTLDSLSADELRAELHAKLAGGWALHRVFSELPIDHFVLFSSASALLSSPRLGAYAAANAFLDALAHHRSALGLPALSVNWGLWGEVGMASQFEEDDVALLTLRGMGVIAPEQGLDLLERLLRTDLPQAAVLPVDWARWRQRYPAFTRAPLLSRLMASDGDAGVELTPTLSAADLEAAPPDERPDLVEEYLAEQVARVLGMAAAELDRSLPLSAMGIDSLMAVELKNRVELDLGAIIPMVSLLQGPSVASLAVQVVERFGAREPDALMTPAASQHDELAEVEDLLAQLDQLSDAQVESLLGSLSTEKEIVND